MYEIERGFNQYLWKGNYREQPEWFINGLRRAQKTMIECRKPKDGKTKTRT